MNGKELIASYMTKSDQIASLNKQIETKRLRAQHLSDAANRNGSVENFVNLMRERNSLLVDIELCKRKIANLENAQPAHGYPEGDTGSGRFMRQPGGVD